MTDDVIFLRAGDTLTPVRRTAYAAEEELQALVADHPELLSGARLGDGDVRWLLVRREAGVPVEEGGGSWFSLDHLLLDHEARPTFVEVKRSSDTRIRREVVGQMLDYAANGTSWWPPGELRRMAEETHQGPERLRERLAELLDTDDEADHEAYWARVEERLRAGEVRLLFVADVIPRELRAIIEFLNAQMPRVEVLGVELAPYAAAGMEAWVPRVVGETEAARREKRLRGGAAPSKTTREAFLDELPAAARAFFARILAAAEAREGQGWRLYWGTRGFSVRVPGRDGRLTSLFYGYPPGATRHDRPIALAYTKGLEPEIAAHLRTALRRVGRFSDAGQYHLDLQPDPERFGDADGIVAVLDEVAAMLRLDPT